jgi:hypothetical protein
MFMLSAEGGEAVFNIRAVIAAELSVLCVAWESIHGET